MANPTVQLIIDAEQGKLAIVTPTIVGGVANVDSALEKLSNPYSYLNKIKFHSDFKYLDIKPSTNDTPVRLNLPAFTQIGSGTGTLYTKELAPAANYTNPGCFLKIGSLFLFNNYVIYNTDKGYVFVFNNIRQNSGKWFVDVNYFYSVWQNNTVMPAMSIDVAGVYVYER
jgi:hypothetical protein